MNIRPQSFLLLLIIGGFVNVVSHAQTESRFPITAQQTSERAIGLREKHVYEFSIDTGEVVRFDVVQTNVDPQLIISDARGNPLREMYFERIAGATAISFIAGERALYRLELKPSGRSWMNGNYRLMMSIPHQSNQADRERINAEITLSGKAITKNAQAGKLTIEQRRKRIVGLQQLVGVWQKFNEPNFELETWYQIGLIGDKLHDVELEATAFEKVQTLALANKEPLVEAWALYYQATLAAERGESETAVAYLTKAVELATQSGAKSAVATIYHRLGNQYTRMQHYEKARDCLQKVVDLNTELGNEIAAASGRVSLAIVSTKFDRALDSTAVYLAALAVFEKHQAFSEKAHVLRSLGIEAAARKEFEVAHQYLNEALRVAEQYGEPGDEGETLLALGLTDLHRNNAQARKNLERALPKLTNHSDPSTEVKVLQGLSYLHLASSEVTESIAKLERALELSIKAGLKEDTIAIRLMLTIIKATGKLAGAGETKGTTDQTTNCSSQGVQTIDAAINAESRGEYPTAIRLFEENIRCGKMNRQNDLVAVSYQQLGGVFLGLNDLTRAEGAYRAASEYLAKSDNTLMKRALVLSTAQLYLRQNRLAETRRMLGAFLVEVKRNNETMLEAYTQQLLGRLALKEKKYNTAHAKFTTVLALLSKRSPAQPNQEVPLVAAESFQGLGNTFAATGDTTRAQSFYAQALVNFRLLDSAIGEAAVLESLMNFERRAEHKRVAIFYGKRSVNLLQTVRRSIKPLDTNIRRSFLSSVESVYRTLAATLLEDNRIAEAQEVLSLLKEEEFYQFTRRSPAAISPVLREIELNADETEAEREYKAITDEIVSTTRRINELEIENQHQPLTPAQLVEEQNLKTELTSLNAKFLESLKTLLPRLNPMKPAGSVNTENTQSWQHKLAGLETGTVLLTTLLTEGRYYVIVTTSDNQIVRSTEISRPELTQQIWTLRALLEKPSSQIFGDVRSKKKVVLIRSLYEILVKPIAADLLQTKVRTLLWSLDGVLRYVPVAVLHDGQSYLVENYANQVVTLAQPPEAPDASPANWRALGAGVSKPIGGRALPQVELELKAIVRDETVAMSQLENGLFPGRRLLNEEFSRLNFDLELRQKPQLVHLATHFSLSSVNDSDSVLDLGDGDKLSLAELRTDKLFELDGVQMITLSACETLRAGKDPNGAEIESLAVITQRRGAKAVLASLWRIADDGTRILMSEFYRLYKNGEGNVSKAEALRKAQIALLKNSKATHNYSHPAYWGAFIILGNL